LISTPAERRLFRAERIEPVADAVVSLLIDCSGSMRQHIERVAMLVDLLSRALEIAGVGSEVLGFSTGAWHGGRAARDWQRAGRPRHPGRLNERCHLVFKDADTPWRRARPSIAALFKADLFREGFDGEAVDWAVERLRQRDEARRMLIVFSDGCPMDSATMQANDDGYLGQHLLQVVQRHEAEGEVQIFGVGVGLDLSVFYRRCQAIDLSQGLRHETLDEIVALIAGRARR
jgi:cobaltochelatase CobT